MTDYLNDSYDLNNPDIVSALDEAPIWSAPFGLKLLQYIDYKPNINVLDIGAGTGFPLTEVAMRLGKSCTVTGIDPWEAALDRIRFKVGQYSISNLNLIKGVAEEMPFEDESFDLITSTNGINNVQDLKKVLDECYRVATMNAQILFTVNLKRTMKEFYDVFRTVLHSLGKDNAVKQMKHHIHEKRMPLVELTEMIQDAGFDITQLIKDEFRYSFSDGSAMLNHYFIKLAFMPSWKEIAGTNAHEVFEKVEEQLNTTASEKGKLDLTIPMVLIEGRKQ